MKNFQNISEEITETLLKEFDNPVIVNLNELTDLEIEVRDVEPYKYESPADSFRDLQPESFDYWWFILFLNNLVKSHDVTRLKNIHSYSV